MTDNLNHWPPLVVVRHNGCCDRGTAFLRSKQALLDHMQATKSCGPGRTVDAPTDEETRQ